MADLGPTMVAVLALHDRKFFDDLIRDPQAAITSRANDLGFDAAMTKHVLGLIDQARKAGRGTNPLDVWDSIKAAKTVRQPILWPHEWPPTPLVGPTPMPAPMPGGGGGTPLR